MLGHLQPNSALSCKRGQEAGHSILGVRQTEHPITVKEALHCTVGEFGILDVAFKWEPHPASTCFGAFSHPKDRMVFIKVTWTQVLFYLVKTLFIFPFNSPFHSQAAPLSQLLYSPNSFLAHNGEKRKPHYSKVKGKDIVSSHTIKETQNLYKWQLW